MPIIPTSFSENPFQLHHPIRIRQPQEQINTILRWLIIMARRLIKQYNYISMKTAPKTLIIMTVVTLISLLAWQNTQPETPNAPRLLASSYQTSSTRTSTVKKLCPAKLNRTSLYSQTDVDTATQYQTSVNSALNIDGNALFGNLTNSNMGNALSLVTSNIIQVAIFVGSFALGLILFLWIWPFLCCCCCCPGCCPSKCCQKEEKQAYTKCELYWPMVILTLALLLTIVTSAYGLATCSNIGPVFTNFACSTAIFTDDLLNGNVTLNGSSFWVGLKQFSTQLVSLSGNLTNINNNFSSLQNTAGSAMLNSTTAITNALTAVKNIPQTGGAALSLTYTSPINGATGSVASTFPAILGTYNTANTLVYAMYQAVLGISTFVTGIQTSAASFTSQMSSISSSVSSIQSTLNSLVSSIDSMDSSLSTFLNYTTYPSQYGNLALTLLFGCMIGFSSLALFGAMFTVCCRRYSCRHLMYFSCLFLFFLALVGFMISTLFSVLVPVFTWTCTYLSTTISSQANFKANLGSALGNTTANQISVCMPFGDGNIVSVVGGNATNGLNNLTSVISGLSSFSPDTYVTQLSGNLTLITNTITYYALGQISDLDSAGFAALTKIANPTQYSGCSNANYLADSWVPSNSQLTNVSYISCTATNGNTGNPTSCGGSITASTATCRGCMDTTLITNIYATKVAFTNALNTRYSSTCAAFVTDMGNVWTYYFSVKNTALGPTDTNTTGSGVLRRTLSAQSLITNNASNTGVYYGLYQIQNTFNNIVYGMTSISNLTDPTYGMLAGLNCQVFGQDFVTMQKVICGSFYKNIYLLRLIVGISSWGILFAMCCIVCTGVRHFKLSRRDIQVGDSEVEQEESPKKKKKNHYGLDESEEEISPKQRRRRR